jgi:signal transduction histidine kinase
MIGKLTLRTRLTLLYAALPLLCGVIVLVLVLTSTRSALFADVADTTPALVELKQQGPAAYEQARARQRDHAEQRLALEAGLALLAVSILSAALGAAVSSHLLGRVRRVTELAKVSSDGDLSQRLNLPGPDDEIRELADTFDVMLARLDESFNAQRRFIANAGHELRTPLTVTRTAVEVTLARPHATEAELRTMGEDALAAIDRSQLLVDSLLALARSEHPTTREADDLAEHAREARDQVSRRAAERNLAVRTSLKPAPVVGDQALLSRAIANLVENAVHHNHDAGEIELSTGSDGYVSWAQVSNTGPDMTGTDVDRLLEPFQRAHPRTPDSNGHGAGLGLSIVAAVARAHRGTVTVQARPADAGGGLIVLFRVPSQARERLD